MNMIEQFQLAPEGRQTVKMPRAARVISTQAMNGRICLWAEIHTGVVKEERTFEVIETGVQVVRPAMRLFVGTVQRGDVAMHIYEIKD